MKAPVQDINDWYEAFENCPQEKLRAILLDTFRQDLPATFIEEGVVGEVMLDVLGEWFYEEKKYEETVDFLEEFERLQQELFRQDAQYYYSYMDDVYFYKGEKEKVLRIMDFYKNNPGQDIDYFLSFHKKLWYWGLEQETEELARAVYAPVDKTPGYIGEPAMEFAIAVFYQSLQKAFEKPGALNLEPVKKDARDFGFDMGPEIWDILEENYSGDLNPEKMAAEFEKDRDNWTFAIEAHYLKYMCRRGFSFQGAMLIWQELRGFWFERAGKRKLTLEAFLNLPQHAFDEYLAEMTQLFFPRKFDICQTLWGAQFVYDFLREYELITEAAYSSASQAINNLKLQINKVFFQNLWQFSFLHRIWPRPDGVPEEIFQAEQKLFEETYNFQGDYTAFRNNFSALFDILPRIQKLPIHQPPGSEKQKRPPRNPANDAERKARKKAKKNRRRRR